MEYSTPPESARVYERFAVRSVVIWSYCGNQIIHTILARSITVVHPAVNGTVEGSNPSEPVRILYPKLNILINTCDRANL